MERETYGREPTELSLSQQMRYKSEAVSADTTVRLEGMRPVSGFTNRASLNLVESEGLSLETMNLI